MSAGRSDTPTDSDSFRFLSKTAFLEHDHIIESAWLEHGAFAGWLTEILKPRCFVELGTYGGFSYFVVCQVVAKLGLGTTCYAVDTWHGDEHNGFYGEELYAAVSATNEKYRGFSTLVRAKFSDALPYFPDQSIDLLHIDGRHFYEDVKEDFEAWLPKLTADAVILFHDINVRTRDFGVWKYFEELKSDHKFFEFFHGHGLGVLSRGQVPPRLGELFEADHSQKDAVRFFYARLGQMAHLRAQILDHKKLATSLANERNYEKAHSTSLQSTLNSLTAERDRLAIEKTQDRAKLDLLERKYTEIIRQRDEAASQSFAQRALSFFTKRPAKEQQDGDGEGLAIRETGLFDEAYYAERYASLLKDGLDPSIHYARTGWQTGCRPNPYFDPIYYLAQNADVSAEGFDPLLHYSAHGWKEGRRPSAEFDPAFYQRIYPDVADSDMDPLLHYLQHGRAEGRVPLPDGDVVFTDATPSDPTVQTMLRNHSIALQPIPIFASPAPASTLTILTDSLAADSLFGGVGTAVVVAALLAKRRNMRLRLATRTVVPDSSAFGTVLKAHGIEWHGATEFVQSPLQDAKPLPFGPEDIMLTTSWWTTTSALGSISPKQIIYLLQEDERMFYAFGDDRLRCSELLNNPLLRTIVNSQLLHDHLTSGPDAIPTLSDRSSWFDPAFPAFRRPTAIVAPTGKMQLFFYARPNHARNLYLRGLELLDACLREGILPADEWEFHFVGHAGIQAPSLFGGVKPIITPKLSWSDYAALAAKMDLSLCLMYTPHPSYPPLDLAAVGAAVVTNAFGLKKDLSSFSRNIVVASTDMDSLKEGMRTGVKIARDRQMRLDNCLADSIQRDWAPALEPAFTKLFL